ncbi:MAG: hypothetical protein SVV67_01435 [Bacillota bacterium]|nr:hypothetical protein [Bacillota bacterium]
MKLFQETMQKDLPMLVDTTLLVIGKHSGKKAVKYEDYMYEKKRETMEMLKNRS